MRSFREYLKEETTDNYIHFTSYKNLLPILRDGKLIGKHYSWDKGSINKTGNTQIASNKGFDETSRELCLIRKGRAKEIKKVALEKPDIKIIFDWKNISDKLRGIKKPYPIAEAVIHLKDAMNRQVDELIRKKYLNPEDKEKIMKKLLNPGLKDEYQLQDELKAEYPGLKRKRLLPLTRNATNRLYLIYQREGEERIDLTKSDIPVSSEYMNIILEKSYGLALMGSYVMAVDGEDDEFKDPKDVKELLGLIERYKKEDPKLFRYEGF